MKTKSIYLIALLIAAFSMSAGAQINLNKLGKQVKRSAEQQVEQKIKEKAARETREALDKTEKKLDQGVSNAASGGTSKDNKEVSKEKKTKGKKTIDVSENKDSIRNDDKQQKIDD